MGASPCGPSSQRSRLWLALSHPSLVLLSLPQKTPGYIESHRDGLSNSPSPSPSSVRAAVPLASMATAQDSGEESMASWEGVAQPIPSRSSPSYVEAAPFCASLLSGSDTLAIHLLV